MKQEQVRKEVGKLMDATTSILKHVTETSMFILPAYSMWIDYRMPLCQGTYTDAYDLINGPESSSIQYK
jgi:hypothetical protein